MKLVDNFNVFLSGDKLHGDDFNEEQIKVWFNTEKEGYANLVAKNKSTYKYSYHELNKAACFKYLANKKYKNILGIGSAYGDELIPIIDKIENITILEPSDHFVSKSIFNKPCNYIKPTDSGDLPFEDKSFDLITIFGVLHHIPNVTHVMEECYRVLNKDGILLVREPIVSMGDWRKKRARLTKYERGIPYKIFLSISSNVGFTILHKTYCDFPIIRKGFAKIAIETYSNTWSTRIDILASAMFKWNLNYHPKNCKYPLSPTE